MLSDQFGSWSKYMRSLHTLALGNKHKLLVVSLLSLPTYIATLFGKWKPHLLPMNPKTQN